MDLWWFSHKSKSRTILCPTEAGQPLRALSVLAVFYREWPLVSRSTALVRVTWEWRSNTGLSDHRRQMMSVCLPKIVKWIYVYHRLMGLALGVLVSHALNIRIIILPNKSKHKVCLDTDSPTWIRKPSCRNSHQGLQSTIPLDLCCLSTLGLSEDHLQISNSEVPSLQVQALTGVPCSVTSHADKVRQLLNQCATWPCISRIISLALVMIVVAVPGKTGPTLQTQPSCFGHRSRKMGSRILVGLSSAKERFEHSSCTVRSGAPGAPGSRIRTTCRPPGSTKVFLAQHMTSAQRPRRVQKGLRNSSYHDVSNAQNPQSFKNGWHGFP